MSVFVNPCRNRSVFYLHVVKRNRTNRGNSRRSGNKPKVDQWNHDFKRSGFKKVMSQNEFKNKNRNLYGDSNNYSGVIDRVENNELIDESKVGIEDLETMDVIDNGKIDDDTLNESEDTDIDEELSHTSIENDSEYDTKGSIGVEDTERLILLNRDISDNTLYEEWMVVTDNNSGNDLLEFLASGNRDKNTLPNDEDLPVRDGPEVENFNEELISDEDQGTFPNKDESMMELNEESVEESVGDDPVESDRDNDADEGDGDNDDESNNYFSRFFNTIGLILLILINCIIAAHFIYFIITLFRSIFWKA